MILKLISIDFKIFIFRYPLFLNLENHCSYEQQGVMAEILKETFKECLLTKPLKDNFKNLPSPEELKYKVLIRVKNFLEILRMKTIDL